MKKHLPSTVELLELAALVLMVAGLQWVLGSWGWTFLFCVGFIWNWSMLNGWVLQRTSEKRYRFSVLKGITLVHKICTAPFARFPILQKFVAILPAGLLFALVSHLLDSSIPWWAAILGSLAFVLVRWQIAHFPRQ